MAHTPGPWTLKCDSTWPFDLHIDPLRITIQRIAYSTGQKTLDDVKRAVGFPPKEMPDVARMVMEQEANVTLMASAPDLLDALQMARTWLDADGRYDMRMIDAALARATQP